MLSAVSLVLGFIVLQTTAIPWSSPHRYDGKPDGPYSTEWQDYFEVTQPLPNISFTLPRSWAGTISVKDEENKNNSLFFWGFEKYDGSLTNENNTEPWGIWLAGGPGYSSIASMMLGNGPFSAAENSSFEENPYSWHKLADFFWIDNPVGVGYSTVGKDGYAADEEDISTDFWNYMDNLVKVFPGLKKRPLYITGESYAGRFITYILKKYFELDNPPIEKIGKIMMGSPSINNPGAFENIPITRVIQTYPQIIGYDSEIFDYFLAQAHACKMDINITYPMKKKVDRITMIDGGFGDADLIGGDNRRRSLSSQPENSNILAAIRYTYDRLPASTRKTDSQLREEHRRQRYPFLESRHPLLPRENEYLAGKDKSKIDSWYGCDLYHHMMYYAINYTYPWNESQSFDFLNIPIAVNIIKTSLNPADWVNNNETRFALHAPQNMDWSIIRQYYWDNDPNGGADGSKQSMYFMDDLAKNMSKHDVGMVLYAGNDDALSGHFSVEVVIQNTTFGGKLGFQKRPETPWYDDDNDYAGVIHQERNWTYVLVLGGGHQLAANSPARAHTIVQRWLFGDDSTGLYDPDAQETIFATPTASGLLNNGVILGTNGIEYSGSTIVAPSKTIASWNSYTLTASQLNPTKT